VDGGWKSTEAVGGRISAGAVGSDDGRWLTARSVMTTRELEALTGMRIAGTKLELVLVGERLFHRVDGGWEEYPPYLEAGTTGVAS
jgi:hypothetical protein